MACKEEFCTNYMVLKPEKASLFDLITFLHSDEVDKKSFIDFPDAEKLRDEWLIFISLLLQKSLIYLKKPMALIGYFLEFCLNLPSSNGGFAGLFLNVLRGKVVKPDKSSESFTSAIGNLDKRVQLDKGIKNEGSRYKAALSMMASKLSYENGKYVEHVIRDIWEMDFLGFYNFWNGTYQEQYSTHTTMFGDRTSEHDLIVVAFRGTEPFDADGWQTDVDLSWYELEGVGKVHGGFMKALGLQKITGWPKELPQGSNQPPFAYYRIREMLREIMEKNKRAKFILTGHSLGGALAILFGAVLSLHEEAWLLDRLEGVYTFGQPRVGDEQFGEFMKEKLKVYDIRYFRYVYCNDMVPRLPYDDKTLLYKHFGACLYYNSFYIGKVLEEEPNKNYFSVLWVIPKNLNAIWELTRSFILPYMRGKQYKEGWFLRLLRVIGLAIPGLSAHAPEDYVNLTLLGVLPSNDEDLLNDPVTSL